MFVVIAPLSLWLGLKVADRPAGLFQHPHINFATLPEAQFNPGCNTMAFADQSGGKFDAPQHNLCHVCASLTCVCLQTALKLDLGQVHEFHQLLTACLPEDLPATEAAQHACYVFLLLSHAKSPDQQTGYRQALCFRPAVRLDTACNVSV